MKKGLRLALTLLVTLSALLPAAFPAFSASGGSAARTAVSAPVRVTVKKVKAGMRVRWTGVAGADGYRVYRRELNAAGDVVRDWRVLLTSEDAGTREYIDAACRNGRRYRYAVRARKKKKGGIVQGKAKTSAALYCLATPEVAAENRAGGIRLTWKPVKAASGYLVYRRPAGASEWKMVRRLKGNGATAWYDRNKTNGVKYVYAVKAYRGNSVSSFSPRTVLFLAAPAKAAAVCSETGMQVTWGRNAKASGYLVYRKAGAEDWRQVASVKGGSSARWLDKTARRGTTYRYRVVARRGKARSGCYNGDKVTGSDLLPVTSKGYSIRTAEGLTYVGGVLIANKSYSLPSSYDPGGLTADCRAAFEKMRSAAAREGLYLYVGSGYRSYETQRAIFNRYCAQDGQATAETYSARPGHSEHQTGLAIDLNDISDSFGNTPAGRWVAEHCHEYGFIIRYPANKTAVTGYIYEPWHIRYLGTELAGKVRDSGLCLEEYLGIDSSYAP